MYCVKCQKHIVDCTCSDIEERLASIAEHENVGPAVKINQAARELKKEDKVFCDQCQFEESEECPFHLRRRTEHIFGCKEGKVRLIHVLAAEQLRKDIRNLSQAIAYLPTDRFDYAIGVLEEKYEELIEMRDKQ